MYLTSNEPVKILYTLDGSPVYANSNLYTSEGIAISKENLTILRFKGIDNAGNSTDEQIARFFLDTRAPLVKVRIDGKVQDDNFMVFLASSEPSKIYYQIGGSAPGYSSPVYSEPIKMQSGQILKYFAVDSAGNASTIGVMNELSKPMVTAIPEGGVYNRIVNVTFAANTAGDIFWRVLPDTMFRKTSNNVKFGKEGNYSLEYFMETPGGMRSVIRRNEYFLDWTSPYVDINLRKGLNDSVLVFFQCTENATIYYTIDGSNPQVSSTVRTAANKFQQSSDRIVLKRNKDLQLAFYAEDVAGNQSSMSVLDLFSPRAVPNVPAGPDRLYDRILSISLNTYDQSTIYFSRHGKMPTTSSPVFSEPITLLASDTIVAFVVDASGFRGDPDTFVYHIDLPPSPHFSFSPETLYTDMVVTFNAEKTIDKESPFEKLMFRWDFDGDGVFETDYSSNDKVTHKFIRQGIFSPVMEVMDQNKRVAKSNRKIMILERCSKDMISIIDHQGHSFCIDRYEWPNIKGKPPLTNVSWVEAMMYCNDAGKRLCTASEWVYTCKGSMQRAYPYGVKYDPEKCPAKGENVWKAGSFSQCNDYGVNDMIGNVWEWVEDRNDEYPLILGGSFKYGPEAQCGLRSQGTIATRSGDTGFRCCK